jgi:hypothetical protein
MRIGSNSGAQNGSREHDEVISGSIARSNKGVLSVCQQCLAEILWQFIAALPFSGMLATSLRLQIRSRKYLSQLATGSNRRLPQPLRLFRTFA